MSKVLKIMKADLTKNFESYGRHCYALLKLQESSRFFISKVGLSVFVVCARLAASEWILMLSYIGLVGTCGPSKPFWSEHEKCAQMHPRREACETFQAFTFLNVSCLCLDMFRVQLPRKHSNSQKRELQLGRWVGEV